MRSIATSLGLGLSALVLMTATATAQPTISVSTDVVTPGQSVNVTVTGIPGESFALGGSSVGAGLTYAGTAFSVGADFTILAVGTLTGAGTAVVPVVPPFLGSTLDRYYVQGATSFRRRSHRFSSRPA